MPAAARATDMHVCPMVTALVPHVGGPALPPGAPKVLIGGMPALRVGDMLTCTGPPDTVVAGSGSVFIGGMAAARMGDSTAHGGSIATRCFIPHVCHDAIGVLAAVTVATACVLEGSVTKGLAAVPPGPVKRVSVEHPTGEFSVELELGQRDPQTVVRAALLRTARLIMRGEVMVPARAWPDRPERTR